MTSPIPEEHWSIAQLAGVIKRRVEDGFDPVWVRGELVGVKRYPSGHWYFGLRDATAKVDCTMWKFAAQRLTAPLEEGVEVFALGAPNVWEERTSLRFNVTKIVPAAAVGAQAQALEKLRQKLAAEGLFDPARKRPLPEYPRKVGVITSIAGAAVRDIITVAHNRWPGIELLVVNAAVQGQSAPAEIVAAFGIVAEIAALDVCIVGRGGGGKEDLLAFNDEMVCRAIAACHVPVVSAVGHEVDVTLADLVADVRAATPSQAAEFVLASHAEAQQRVNSLTLGVTRSMMDIVRMRRERMVRTRDRMGHALMEQLHSVERRLSKTRERLAPALHRQVIVPKQRLVRMGDLLGPLMQRRLITAKGKLAQRASQLDALSPLKVLGRGYALPTDEKGRVLRSSSDFVPGKKVRLRVTDGTVSARVEE